MCRAAEEDGEVVIVGGAMVGLVRESACDWPESLPLTSSLGNQHIIGRYRHIDISRCLRENQVQACSALTGKNIVP